VVIQGDRAVVGAYSEDRIGWNYGAACVFERGLGGWAQVQRLEALVPEVGAHFGHRHAIDGDVLAISGHREDVVGALNTGGIHRFERDGTGWHELAVTHAEPPS